MQCCRDCWSAVRAIGEDLGAELGGFRGFGVFLGSPNEGGGGRVQFWGEKPQNWAEMVNFGGEMEGFGN